jgi:hypothetical protein
MADKGAAAKQADALDDPKPWDTPMSDTPKPRKYNPDTDPDLKAAGVPPVKKAPPAPAKPPITKLPDRMTYPKGTAGDVQHRLDTIEYLRKDLEK